MLSSESRIVRVCTLPSEFYIRSLEHTCMFPFSESDLSKSTILAAYDVHNAIQGFGICSLPHEPFAVHQLRSLQRGYGSAILRSMESLAISWAKPCITVDSPEISSVLQFYLRHGFTPISRDSYFVQMQKNLR